ncbi:hypothetical protein QTG56_24985 (plasmid) [Rossellomorea sp. AcN35-11]|nr:hypothetical protein [Rossellomorea aquimaris]WJV31889.1 hypothetical protein QTG56_24985 [Rossellomorea sp. AcN35-11]
MNLKKLLCLVVGHKRTGLTITYGFTNVERTSCERCETELAFLLGKGIIGKWKTHQDSLEKEGFFNGYHKKPAGTIGEDLKRMFAK